MKTALPALWAQAPATQRREPSASELSAGIPCGPADDKLFNEIFYRLTGLEKELANLLAKSGLNPDETALTQVLQAVRLQKFGTRTAAGTANALAIGLDPPIAAYADIAGAPLRLKLGAAPNSGAATLAVDGLPAKPILLADGMPLSGGELPAGGVMPLCYDAGSDAFLIPGLVSAAFQGQFYGPDSGSANNLVITIPRYGNALVAGRVFLTKVAAGNTSTNVQANLSGTGNRAVKLGDGSAPPAGAIAAGQMLALAFDGASFQVIDEVGANFPAILYGTDSGSANALVASIPGYGSAYVPGQLIWVVKGAAANTASNPTINVNGIGARAIVKRDGAAPAAGDLPAGALLGLIHDGANMRLVTHTAATRVPSLVLYYAGAGTFTVPADTYALLVELAGPGGGGGYSAAGGAASGGSAGDTVRGAMAVTPGQVIAYAVGAAGAGGNIGTQGLDGGNTSFGAWIAKGGVGGMNALANNVSNSIGNVGAISTGPELIVGAPSDAGLLLSNCQVGGRGGASAAGGYGGNGARNGGTGGNSGAGIGGGGGGGSNGSNGGGGAPGRIRITY